MTKDELLKKEVQEYISYHPTEGSKDFIVYKVKVGENAFSYIVENKNELSMSDWVKMYEGTERECYQAVGYLDAIEKLGQENNPEMNLELFLLKDKKDVVYGYLEAEKDFDIMKLKGMNYTEAIKYLLENKIAFKSRTGYPPTLHFKES